MKRHILLGVVLFLAARGRALAQSPLPTAPTPLTFDQRFHIYLKQTYSVSSILVPAVFSGIDQAAGGSNQCNDTLYIPRTKPSYICQKQLDC